ncbi:glutamate--cysteine ligase [Synechococcus sp. CS-1324]|uniref:glutamate--cysteine ligase n=1 Tax=Synechococcus sp. CS-1324 TaxID=2847980 RepID=UPI000DB12D4A|nr:glutamate--cysteine ligase [Synechococcus sp. CS-1324]MCT0229329.1 glutamate--cysteine ligase [Synechococcus sp. CS-1324]PZV01499.1 MAG: putative glutamate--cysteine ligase [Cyanobium sp.]
MSGPLLLKGFEVELFTGRADGSVVGVAEQVAATLPGFVTEPDHRNLEYITHPDAHYSDQLTMLQEPRRQLRQWLQKRQLTLLPGSTLSLGDSSRFERSDPANAYHGFIEASYGTRVVTASVHINLGITAMEPLFAACRLIRCEAALLLALSASSPFLDGEATGAHSQRWLQFPLTPAKVPLFLNHPHYIGWMEEQLLAGTMQNVRHLWTSVRPNGECRPHDLNRLEIRICDLISDPLVLLAITAFAELRLHQLGQDPAAHDPLQASRLSPLELAELADSNDLAAARGSLDASLLDWRTGEHRQARAWIQAELSAMQPLARQLGLDRWLAPLDPVLERGNEAMRWLALHSQGASIASILSAEIQGMAESERQAAPRNTAALNPLG